MSGTISYSSSGSFSETLRFLQKVQSGQIFAVLSKYGEKGRAALAAQTPSETGETANSWSYSYEVGSGSATIFWRNSHMAGTTSVAILLQYGHGTGTGGYVQGRDYINPVMRPLFDQMANEVWRAVIS